ncbi:MAG: glutathione peroxidase, partial [Burkholderiales bacterium]|nr:glutathione peroxidase [Burkholderiales bacterium]
VTGAKANQLHAELAKITGKQPAWNFHKYLIGRDGKVIENFPSKIEPMDKDLTAKVEKALAN